MKKFIVILIILSLYFPVYAEQKNVKVGNVENKTYVIEESTNIKYNASLKTGVSYRIKASKEDLNEILIDGKVIDKNSYTVTQDGEYLNITINDDYVEALDSGKHDVVIDFKDGEVTSNITIPENTKEPFTYDNIIKYVVIFGISIIGIIIAIRYKKGTQTK